ncbi:MAG: hypothetical protein ISR58_17440 [Anaerolineales bacterium]|nr:hypothetical protein [Chloroflexota bacterium]MBL6982961.1 hypothetical protein [Anaerolineales bacterium]
MPRAGTLGDPQPYKFFGRYAGIPFWPGGLTLLAAAPGIGKTSWLLRMIFEGADAGVPSAIGCYEHTALELKYRLRCQAEAAVGGPHDQAVAEDTEQFLVRGAETVLLPLSDQEDTIRCIEDILITDYGFPVNGPALLAVDYLQRIPVIGLTGRISEDLRAGEAAARLRALSRKHDWAIIAAAALSKDNFDVGDLDDSVLTALLGDERVPYEADRVYVAYQAGEVQECGCVRLGVHTSKDRTGPKRSWEMNFWGERFYPSLDTTHP